VAESGGQQHENRALNLKVRSMNFHFYAHQDAVVPLQRATRVSSGCVHGCIRVNETHPRPFKLVGRRLSDGLERPYMVLEGRQCAVNTCIRVQSAAAKDLETIGHQSLR
jgi:hypothetical protein